VSPASVGFVAGSGASASGSGATLLYDTATGFLSFDGDGSGAGSATLIARFDGRPALTQADILWA
jgi:hypothetical protein